MTPSFVLRSRSASPHSGQTFVVNEKSLYASCDALISATKRFVSASISFKNTCADFCPLAMASKSFSHFSVNSGVTNAELTNVNNCFPLGVTAKTFARRSINSDLINFSIISARVAGVPNEYFSICASKLPSVASFGGDVNS